MEKTNKTILLYAVAVLTAFIVVFSINEKPQIADGIKITKIKSQYSTSENVVLSGTSKSSGEIALSFKGKIGKFKPDGNGKWVVNLGKMSKGKYSIKITAKDLPAGQNTATAQFSVNPDKSGISLNKILNSMTASISSAIEETPEKIIMVPQNSPRALKGRWKLVK